jgi:hypothetical protein
MGLYDNNMLETINKVKKNKELKEEKSNKSKQIIIIDGLMSEDEIKKTLGEMNFFPNLPDAENENASDGSYKFKGLDYQRMILFSVICNFFKDLSWK